jgi:integrase
LRLRPILAHRAADAATSNGCAVPGDHRALLYRVAAETGFRAGELRSLTAASFTLEVDPPTAKVSACYSKHRQEDVQVLKKSTAGLLKSHLTNKMPNAPALRMPGKRMLSIVLQKDLAAARSRWLDSAPDQLCLDPRNSHILPGAPSAVMR